MNGPHFFGLHAGHYTEADERAAEIVAQEFASDDVRHINFTEPTGEKRGWWECRNYGQPHDRETARAVLDRFRELRADGGTDDD